mmetsp:Transcript_27535/g.42333  ORF Transcript_27535/g.42333 Transcript_27535/m.42333 type:complete len:278 (-) Transcript_27535:488-1321(-)
MITKRGKKNENAQRHTRTIPIRKDSFIVLNVKLATDAIIGLTNICRVRPGKIHLVKNGFGIKHPFSGFNSPVKNVTKTSMKQMILMKLIVFLSRKRTKSLNTEWYFVYGSSQYQIFSVFSAANTFFSCLNIWKAFRTGGTSSASRAFFAYSQDFHSMIGIGTSRFSRISISCTGSFDFFAKCWSIIGFRATCVISTRTQTTKRIFHVTANRVFGRNNILFPRYSLACAFSSSCSSYIRRLSPASKCPSLPRFSFIFLSSRSCNSFSSCFFLSTRSLA